MTRTSINQQAGFVEIRVTSRQELDAYKRALSNGVEIIVEERHRIPGLNASPTPVATTVAVPAEKASPSNGTLAAPMRERVDRFKKYMRAQPGGWHSLQALIHNCEGREIPSRRGKSHNPEYMACVAAAKNARGEIASEDGVVWLDPTKNGRVTEYRYEKV